MKKVVQYLTITILMLLMTLSAIGIGNEHFHFISDKFPGNEKFFFLGIIYIFFFLKIGIESTPVFAPIRETRNYKQCEYLHYGLLLMIPLHEFVCEPLGICGIDYAIIMLIMVFFPELLWKLIGEMIDVIRKGVEGK